MAGRLQDMITPQQAAAMSPRQARRMCVELSAQLASLAAGMEELEEENAGWLMAMRRAASMARTSGLPEFREAGLPPFGQEQACEWLLRFVEKGLGAIADAGSYRHMLFGRRSEKIRRPGPCKAMGKGAARKDPEAGRSSPCIEKRIEVKALEDAELEAMLRKEKMADAMDGAADRLKKQQEKIESISGRLARAREELKELEKDAGAHEIPGAGGDGGPEDQGKGAGDQGKEPGAGDQGNGPATGQNDDEGGSAPGAGCGPVPEQHAGISGGAGGRDRRRSPSAGDWDKGREPDNDGKDEERDDGSGEDAGAGGLPPMREPVLVVRRPDGTSEIIAGRWASMAKSDIAVRKNMDSIIAKLRTIKTADFSLRAEGGREIRMSAAESCDVFLIDAACRKPGTSIKEYVAGIARERRSEKATPENPCGYSPDLMAVLRGMPDKPYYDPKGFKQKHWQEIYAMRPMYSAMKRAISEGTMVSLLAVGTEGCVPWNRVIQLLLRKGFCSSREHIHALLLDTARILHPAAELTRKLIATENRILMGDETPITVVQFRGEGPSKNQIWAVLAGPGENRPGVLYLARPDRSSAVLLKALGAEFPDGPDGKPRFSSSVEYFMSDHCPSYDAAFRCISSGAGVEITQANCMAHARRKFHYALGSMDLWDSYCCALEEGFGRFEARLAALRIRSGRITDLDAEVMRALLYIDMLFSVEREIKDLPRDEIGRQRNARSRVLANALKARLRWLAEKGSGGSIVQVQGRHGAVWRVRGGPLWAKAVAYALNCGAKLWAFLDEPGLPLSNNLSERSLRGCSMLADERILQTADGACAYSDLMTLCGTCRMNGVDFEDYLAWLIAGIKLRLEVSRARRGDPRLQCMQPTTAELRKLLKDSLDPKEGVRYNPKFECSFDRAGAEGLTVWDYKRLSSSGDGGGAPPVL